MQGAGAADLAEGAAEASGHHAEAAADQGADLDGLHLGAVHLEGVLDLAAGDLHPGGDAFNFQQPAHDREAVVELQAAHCSVDCSGHRVVP